MNGIAGRSRFTAWEPYRGSPNFSTSRNRLLANTSQQKSQLWEIPCFKGLRGGWFHGSGTKTLYSNCWCDRQTRINSAQKLNRRNSTNHQNRYAPRIFYRSASGSITTGRSHFLHCTIWVNSRVNPTTQSRKARHSNCYKKDYRVRYSGTAKCLERLLSR